jgi:hypothetical protein
MSASGQVAVACKYIVRRFQTSNEICHGIRTDYENEISVCFRRGRCG